MITFRIQVLEISNAQSQSLDGGGEKIASTTPTSKEEKTPAWMNMDKHRSICIHGIPKMNRSRWIQDNQEISKVASEKRPAAALNRPACVVSLWLVKLQMSVNHRDSGELKTRTECMFMIVSLYPCIFVSLNRCIFVSMYLCIVVSV